METLNPANQYRAILRMRNRLVAKLWQCSVDDMPRIQRALRELEARSDSL